ncbi:uncharacterized protein il11b [Neolamprologus brichardi]|uniref:uncharacterized protein il11b n=1 Tax=Neolamprologus brichardi TaxID=32507 RepID=UPI0003EC407C|nr:uncharacterized protein il11b [Neolamprologus brichardi]
MADDSVFHDATSFLLYLVILAELFVHSSSRPTPCPYSVFEPMIHQLDKIIASSKKLHGLPEAELVTFMDVEHKLDGLPVIKHTAAHLSSLKVNESLPQLYVYAESFRLHTKWLKTAQVNVSVPFQAAEGASNHLEQLSDLTKKFLEKIGEQVPETASPSLPVVSTAFEALRFSVEISDRLQVFCHWSKRILRQLQRRSPCPKH